MQKYRNQMILGVVLVLAIYIAVLLALDSQTQLTATEGVVEQIAAFPLALLVPVLLSQIAVIGFRFWEWHYYLGVIGARDKISLADSLIIFTAAFTMVVSPGKAGEVLKSVFLKARTGVPVAHSAPVVIAERVVDGLAVIVILVMALLLAGDQLALGEYDGLSRMIVFSSGLLLALGLIAVQIVPLARFVLRVIRTAPLLRRLHNPLAEFYESSREVFRLRHVLPMTGVGVGVYLASSLGFMLVLLGYGLEPDGRLLLWALFIVGITSAIGALSLIPNGAGVTEVSNILLLLALVGPVYPELMTPAVAAAASLIQGFFHKWFRVLVGALVVLVFRRRLFNAEVEAVLAELEAERSGRAVSASEPAA